MCGVLLVPPQPLGAANASAANGDPVALIIRVTEGNGATYLIGSRATRGITIVVTDEAGTPVEGALVGFSLPADGPSGVFGSGSKTEIVSTRGDGRAVAWGMHWNRTPGPLEIRVTAVKGTARAGTVATQYLATSPAVSRPTGAAERSAAAQRGDSSDRDELVAASPAARQGAVLGSATKRLAGHKWIWMTLAVAGAAVAGAAIGGAGGSSGSTSAASPAQGVQIGTPTIVLGRP